MDLGKKMKSFVKQYVAVVKGDDAEAQGEKVFRQADSALQTHIANLKGDTISLEDNVTNAKEELNLARVNNGQIISDRNEYVNCLLEAKNNLIEAKYELEVHKLKLEFLEGELKNLSSEN